jgi:hypothetical protein
MALRKLLRGEEGLTESNETFRFGLTKRSTNPPSACDDRIAVSQEN